jgi:hypothetical protein
MGSVVHDEEMADCVEQKEDAVKHSRIKDAYTT